MMDVPCLTKEQVAVELVDGRILHVRGSKLKDNDANGRPAASHDE
jgi:hypothetical protein